MMFIWRLYLCQRLYPTKTDDGGSVALVVETNDGSVTKCLEAGPVAVVRFLILGQWHPLESECEFVSPAAGQRRYTVVIFMERCGLLEEARHNRSAEWL
jgi:hypothetical protein